MLHLTIRPTTTCTPAGKVYLDAVKLRVEARILAGELTSSTGRSYINALDAFAEWVNRPPTQIPVDLRDIEARLPEDGFDPARQKSHKAYALMRRRILASVREYWGVHEKMNALREQEDEWTDLFAAMQPYTKAKSGSWAWHPMCLAAMRSFALVARAHGVQPRDLDVNKAQMLDDLYLGNKRRANRACLQRLDDIRKFPNALPLLPRNPIGFDAAYRQKIASGLPVSFENQFETWITTVTRSGWDPVEKAYSDHCAKHAHVLRSAFRCYLRIALEFDLISRNESEILPVLRSDEAIRLVAQEMFARKARTKSGGKLEVRTSRKYLRGIRQVLDAHGVDTTVLGQIIANNKDSRRGAKADKSMTKKNRAFCEALVEKLHLQRRFLFSFKQLREEAEAIMARAKIDRRQMTKNEIARVRMLGAAACFAAIEIGGAPIRVGNAMALTCMGDDAQIRIPRTSNKQIQVVIPEELTKNRAQIEFPVPQNKHGCVDTIRWYFDVIRPLFPYANGSDFLFPAVRAFGKPMDPTRFGERFSEFMRTIVDLPMTPHQMRHGQTSLLLNAHPEEIEVIAKRIDDSVDTLRRFYGWLNAMRIVERGQDLLVGLMNG